MCDRGQVLIKKAEIDQLDPDQRENAFCLLLKDKGAPFEGELIPIANPGYEWQFREYENGNVKVKWRKLDETPDNIDNG